MIKLSKIKKEQAQPETVYVDLNCDLAEGIGVYYNSREEDIIPYVSSVNISCGSHSGDHLKIMEAIQIAKKHTLCVGAHIGYPDLTGFGYREMNLSYEELQALILFQVGALKAVANAYKMNVDYVRPHGAMYKQIANDPAFAIQVAMALEIIDPWLVLVGPVGASLENVKQETRIRTAGEIYVDYYYDEDGNILLDEPINDIEKSVAIATKLIKENKLTTKAGAYINVDFTTIHLSSKDEQAIELASRIHAIFETKPYPIPVCLVGDSALA